MESHVQKRKIGCKLIGSVTIKFNKRHLIETEITPNVELYFGLMGSATINFIK